MASYHFYVCAAYDTNFADCVTDKTFYLNEKAPFKGDSIGNAGIIILTYPIVHGKRRVREFVAYGEIDPTASAVKTGRRNLIAVACVKKWYWRDPANHTKGVKYDSWSRDRVHQLGYRRDIVKEITPKRAICEMEKIAPSELLNRIKESLDR